MIGQNPQAEVATFSSAEIGIQNLVLRTEVAERTRDLMPNSGRRSRAGVFRTEVGNSFDVVNQ